MQDWHTDTISDADVDDNCISSFSIWQQISATDLTTVFPILPTDGTKPLLQPTEHDFTVLPSWQLLSSSDIAETKQQLADGVEL